ncbi:hypothetical protein ACFV3Q_30525 [Streptomyces mexicanus]
MSSRGTRSRCRRSLSVPAGSPSVRCSFRIRSGWGVMICFWVSNTTMRTS